MKNEAIKTIGTILATTTIVSGGFVLSDTDAQKIIQLEQDKKVLEQQVETSKDIKAKRVIDTRTGDVILDPLGESVVESISVDGFICTKE